MPRYTQESIEALRSRIDLVEVLSSHLQLHRSGSSYKALCPFHEEKTPSFIVQRGDSHYHCFGCGAHGDAIAFLMSHLKMGFLDALESLAERFHVTLEEAEKVGHKNTPSKGALKLALERACQFYHFVLLYTQEGEEALRYLYKRGIDRAFIQRFRLGFAPPLGDAFCTLAKHLNIDERILIESGLFSPHRRKDFFADRITFPICDPLGAVIGFSARKFKEETYGGKYINTPETLLFKKSHVLFGLSYCRQKIAKEREAMVVEGQLDALRLIYLGFDYAVAGQGTAFGEGHALQLLQLGVQRIFLALDADEAGQEAAVKIGHLFQKKGVEVRVVRFPSGKDPDSFLREEGAPALEKLLKESIDYLTFLFAYHGQKIDLNSPSQKNALVQTIAKTIREWEHPVMVHESVRALAVLAKVPESVIEVEAGSLPNLPIKRALRAAVHLDIDPDKILETDLLRWMILIGDSHPEWIERIARNVTETHFCIPSCRSLFALYMKLFQQGRPKDLLALGALVEHEEEETLLSEILQKKINLQKPREGIEEVLQKILLRSWMQEREKVHAQIKAATYSDEEMLLLAKRFEELKAHYPRIS